MAIYLDVQQILIGIFNISFIIISLVISILFLRKYIKQKENDFLMIGIVWFLISTPWLHGALTFILMLFDVLLMKAIRMIIFYMFIPIAITIWMNTFTNFLYWDKKKLLVAVYCLISVICEVLFFIFLFIDIKGLVGDFDYANGIYFIATYKPFIRFSMLFFLASGFITFMLFAKESLESTNPEVKWKGIFLVIAFSSYTVCAILDSFAFFSQYIALIVLIRLLLILSSIEFYLGWFLPDFVVKLLRISSG